MLYGDSVLIEGFDGTKNRPIVVDEDGNIVVAFKAIFDTPEIFEDTNFVTGDSPIVLDCNTQLGRNATQFEIINDGPGNFTVAISNDGIFFGDETTVKQQEVYAINNISVDSIRITHVADSAYRARVI